MSENVLIGTLTQPLHIKPRHPFKEPFDITKRSTDINKWKYRAMWSYLRLQCGRKIDDAIKAELKGLPRAERLIRMKEFFSEAVLNQDTPRMMQFIVDDSKHELNVLAVASLKHLLILPSEVYEMAEKIIDRTRILDRYKMKQLSGTTWKLRELSGLKVGLQIYGGTITTRFAIKITSWIQVLGCMNPLSWLGTGNFQRFGLRTADYERILRIKKRDDLEPRLQQGIEQAIKRTNLISKQADRAKTIPVTPKTAKIVTSAFALSFRLGAKSIEQILERFKEEKQSQWGLAMAASWVAAHGFFMTTPKGKNRYVEQRLSTIAGATMIVDDIKTVEEKSLAWLKNHIKTGSMKSVKELLEDVI